MDVEYSVHLYRHAVLLRPRPLQMGARFYNPAVGRFITRDTYRGNIYQPWTQNLYAYCNNNPVNFVDPTGHFVVDDFNDDDSFKYSDEVFKSLSKIY